MVDEATHLRPLRIFLGGPFSAALKQQGRDNYEFVDGSLRQRLLDLISTILTNGLELLNSHLVDSWGEVEFQVGFSRRDFTWVEACDVYLALLPNDPSGAPYRTDGTMAEIGYAIAANKDVLLLIDEPENQQWSFFVKDMIKSGLVRIMTTESFNEDPLGHLLDGLANPDADPKRRSVTDVKLWNWLQNHCTVPLPITVGRANLIIYPGVMNPRFSHSPDFLMSFWNIPRGARVLDMGCGSGVSGINALLEGAGSLVSVDINSNAVENTLENLRRNGLEDKAEVIRSDGFEKTSGLFDVILFNPPYWEFNASTPMEKACFEGANRPYTSRFFSEIADHLSPNGRVFVAYADQGDIGKVSRLIECHGLRVLDLHVQRPDYLGSHVRIGWQLCLRNCPNTL